MPSLRAPSARRVPGRPLPRRSASAVAARSSRLPVPYAAAYAAEQRARPYGRVVSAEEFAAAWLRLVD
ncbi:hypothetical protein ACFRKD_16975 [Streptomyces niveus]|uniref:hypothetical protein n=1 Tax=Streptomyces niveus TaxID=193462 RepID=UPI003695E4F9